MKRTSIIWILSLLLLIIILSIFVIVIRWQTEPTEEPAEPEPESEEPRQVPSSFEGIGPTEEETEQERQVTGDSAAQLTSRLLEQLEQYSQTPEEEREVTAEEITATARERQDKLRELAELEPVGVYQLALEPEQWQQLPEAAEKYIERRRTVSGTLNIESIDRQVSYEQYFLVTPARERITLYSLIGSFPVSTSGYEVEVTGIGWDEMLVVSKPEDFRVISSPRY